MFLKRNRRILLPWLVAIFLCGGAIAGTLTYGGSSNSDEAGVTREQVLALSDSASIAASRSSLGFSANQQVIDGLLEDKRARRFFLETGLLLTTGEKAKFDARMALADSLTGALKTARGSNAFAGARLEHSGSGVFHFYVTSNEEGDSLRSTLLQMVPNGAAVQIHQVEHSHEYLTSKMSQAWSFVSDTEKGSNGLHSVRVDTINNGLIIEIDESAKSSNPNLATRIANGLEDIPVNVIYAIAPTDDSCTISDCIDPMAAGIRIKKGSLDGGDCTLGFIVRWYSDVQALTAGHCGYTGSNDWYHDGFGTSSFGSEIANWTYLSIGLDAMVIDIPDDQVSNHIASCANNSYMCVDVSGYMYNSEIYIGMVVSTLGEASGFKTGGVTNLAAEWTSETCNCEQYGIATDVWEKKKGDSGGPVWRNDDAVSIHARSTDTHAYGPTIDDILTAYRVALQIS